MNNKKVKKLRKVAKMLEKVENGYNTDRYGSITLKLFSEKKLLKDLKKSFK